ncbi:MAG TPA: acetyl-CoA carboxylase biotin carboxyl carrier protein [Gaiellaceae bacterium]|nr:acetyl-CoA carboxylase biotin carboxyl carrier protein [Gaiellaceae bacterium]
MPALIDTTVRLLSQEPLVGNVPTASILDLAELLDGAGFAALEVSGGGVFDSAVRRGVESPWERIRAIRARTKTPLGMALRGRFLVGSQPVGGDFVRRFVMTAAENGIDVFRLHDPLNDVSNLQDAGEAITSAEREFDAGLLYSPGPTGETDTLVERAKKLPELGAARILLHDPSGSLEPHRSGELVSALAEASGLPIGIYCQGSGGSALAAALEAARAGADRIACTTYPVALVLHRVAAEGLADALRGLGLDPGIDVPRVWKAAELVDEHIGDEPITPLTPRIAVRAAAHDLPAGLVAALESHLRALSAGDRLDEVLDELGRIRAEAGWPPLAAPIGQVLGSQALIHVLSAARYQVVVDELRALYAGDFGQPPTEFDPTARRAIELVSDGTPAAEPAADLDAVRDEARGLAASDEELLLLALFGDEAEALLHAVRGRARGEEGLVGGSVDQTRAETIRELVRIVQESGVGEIAVEESGMRVTVKRREETEAAPQAPEPAPSIPTPDDLALPAAAVAAPETDGVIRVEAPMVGTFYRAPSPGAPPFVEEGASVARGQTLCILEAMKLMNEIKSELDGTIRRIHVGNGEAVEFGQLLFEIEPALGRPVDAL